MNAGYLSAEACFALKPRTKLCELSLEDCYMFQNEIAKELRNLFLDSDTINALSCIEILEEAKLQHDSKPIYLLESLLTNAKEDVIQLLSQIGYNCFLQDYAFVSYECLLTRNLISRNNIGIIKDFISKYRKEFCCYYNIDLAKKEEEIYIKPVIEIDNNALSISNIEYKKYIIYLSSLDEKEFVPIENYIKQLLQSVSVRTQNAIRSIGYQFFCVNYLFADDYKLLKIRNFGRKSIHDLNKVKRSVIEFIISKYNDSITYNNEATEKSESKPLSLKELIGDIQYQILVDELHHLISGLSVRAHNGISSYKGDFIEDYVHNYGDIKSLKNIGKKTEEEISKVIFQLRDMASLMKMKQFSSDDISNIQNKSFFKNYWDDFAQNYNISMKHLPMFHIIENVTKELLKQKNWQIFNTCVPLFDRTAEKSLDQVSESFNFTRERCRQICTQCNQQLRSLYESTKIKEINDFHKIILRLDDWQYIINNIKNRDYIDFSEIKPYLDDEKCCLSKEFALLLIHLLTLDSHVVIGKDVLRLQTRTKQIWKHTYLVKKELAESFDFNIVGNLIEETESELYDDIEITAEQMVLDTFYSAWTTNFNSNLVKPISDVLSLLLIQEFNKIPDENCCFTLDGKKDISISDLIYNILHINGNPMPIDDLLSVLKTTYSKQCKASLNINYIVSRDPRMSMVDKNTVGLLEWEHIKVGSIRDIIVQFLFEHKEPQSLTNIIKYVQKYRTSSENSIRTTMGSGDQFVLFEGVLYGLKDKIYSDCYHLRDNRIKTFYQRINELKEFIVTNKRFPFTQSDNQEEAGLRRWWDRIIKRINDLPEEQIAEVKKIREKYVMLPMSKSDTEWYKRYSNYKAFVLEYHRKPTSRDVKQLYDWFEKTSKNFINGILNAHQEKLYIELCNLL